MCTIVLRAYNRTRKESPKELQLHQTKLIFDERVANAQEERDEAKKLALERERELLAERRHRKLILRVCGILGVIFAVSGLFFLAIDNLRVGGALILPGIVFTLLALTFRYLKVKAGPFEIEAKQ